jgi:hypothetical protein
MANLTVLLPELRRLAGSAVLARWLSRGDRLPDSKPGREAALRGCFELLGNTLPSAALTRSLDANDAAGALWLRADPCHVAVDAVAVRLLAIGSLGLSQEESGELARALRPLFGDAGFPLEAAAAERWYLRCAAEARLPRFTDPDLVLGDDLLQHLPNGDNERQWRHLLNEAQVILHNHPVNARRTQRGLPAANSVWFWGAGKLPEWVRTPYARVVTDDAVAAALAKRAGVAALAVMRAGDIVHNAAKATLLDLAHARTTLQGDWFAPLDAAVRSGAIAALTLRFEDGQAVSYKRRHRWRFWRRLRAGPT